MKNQEPARKLNGEDFETIRDFLLSSSYADLALEPLMRFNLNSCIKEAEGDNLEGEWNKKDLDGNVKQDIYEYSLGTLKYHRKQHEISVMYTSTEGEVISKHGHYEKVHFRLPSYNSTKEYDVKRIAELYIYYIPRDLNVPYPIEALNGFIPKIVAEYCPRGKEHRLVNNFGLPVYIISIKIKSRY